MKEKLHCKTAEEFIKNYYEGCSLSQLELNDSLEQFKLFNIVRSNNKYYNLIGDLYFYGMFVDQNYDKAISWYEKSANMNDDRGQYNLALCYEFGYGTIKDLNKAISWYEKSAKNNNTDAEYTLGYLYYKGKGVEQNYEFAVHWYIKAAEKGHMLAQYNLAICYEFGNGVSQNYEKVIYWYEKSAEQGYARAQCNLGYLYDYGEGVVQNYETAVQWYIKSAEQGYARAQCNLGYCYELGNGINQDHNQAIYWYTKSAEQGYKRAEYNLALCYDLGKGIMKDTDKALYWYTKSAENNESRAQFWLGKYYENKDIEKAIYWYTQAAEKNHVKAQAILGICYELSATDEKHLEQAIFWYKKALDNGFEFVKENYLQAKEKLYQQQIKEFGIHVGKRSDVFISWTRKDEKIKNKIVNYIENKGLLTCWHSDRDSNGPIAQCCKDAIDRSSCFFLILSKNSLNSYWVKQEVIYILEKIEEKLIDLDSIKIGLYKVEKQIKMLCRKEPTNPFVKLYNLSICSVNIGKDSTKLSYAYSHILSMVQYSVVNKYKECLVDRHNRFDYFLSNSLYNEKSEFDKKLNSLHDDRVDSAIIATSVEFKKGYVNRLLNNNIKDDELLKNDVSLIYGEAGSGKTLYISQIIKNNYKKDNYLFFVSKCNDLYRYIKETDKTFKDYLFKLFNDVLLMGNNDKEELYYQIFESLITKHEELSKNKIIIILDAIDELDNQKDIKLLTDYINNFLNIYKDVKFIFTSRNQNDSINLRLLNTRSVETYYLDMFNDYDIKELFQNIIENSRVNLNDNEVTQFFVKLDDLENDIKRNPLLLSNLVIIYLQNRDIPQHKFDIINKTVSIIVSEVEKDRGINFIHNDVLMKISNILEHYSFYLQQGLYKSTYELLQQALKDSGINENIEVKAMDLTDYLRRRSIIMNNDFYHKFFKEYFSSKCCFRNLYNITKNQLHQLIIEFVLNKKTNFELLIDYTKTYFSTEEWHNVTATLMSQIDYECESIINKEEVISKTISILIQNNVYEKVLRTIKQMKLYNKEIFESNLNEMQN